MCTRTHRSLQRKMRLNKLLKEMSGASGYRTAAWRHTHVCGWAR